LLKFEEQTMKLLMENWRRYLKEEVEEEAFRGVQDVLKKNKNVPEIQEKAEQITPEDIKEYDSFFYVKIPEEFSGGHIARHFKENPGSQWKVSPEKVYELIDKAMQSGEPKQDKKGPWKYKWINYPVGEVVGLDNVIKLEKDDPRISVETDMEPFGLVKKPGVTWEVVNGVIDKFFRSNDVLVVNKSGEEYSEEHFNNKEDAFVKQDIGYVKDAGGKKETDSINVIVGTNGKFNNKNVFSLVTVFPGTQPVDDKGDDITDKQGFKEHGYYFIK